MGWAKREVDTNLVILGDAEGNARKVGGLLAGIMPDRRYPDNRRYELVQQDGTVKSLAGSASINSQLGPADVGRFVKLLFAGWEKGGNGRWKKIEVHVYEGEPTPEMHKWPRFSELQTIPKGKKNGAPADADEIPPPDDDDDLPF